MKAPRIWLSLLLLATVAFGAQQTIVTTGGGQDTVKQAFDKTNANFDERYGKDGLGIITPTDSTTQNNWNPTGLSATSTIAWSGTATTIINGLATQGAGKIKKIRNATTDYLLLLTPGNTNSSSTNVFNLPHGFPLPLMPGDIATFEDNGSTGWDLVSFSAAGQPMGMNEFSDFTASTLGPFQSVASGTGATIANNSNGSDTTEKSAGIMILTMGTTTTGRSHIGASSTGMMAPTTFSGLVVFRGNSSSLAVDGTETYSFIIGFQDASAGTFTDGAAWEYRWNGTAPEWAQDTADNGSVTRSTTGSPTPSSENVWLMVFVNTAWTKAAFISSQNSMDFTVHEVTAGLPSATHTTAIGASCIKSAGTTSRSCIVELLGYRIDGRRG